MLKILNTFLTDCTIIVNNQHGFRKEYSATTAACQYLEKVYEALDNHEQTSLDLIKAFDLVDHEILLHKLYLMSIRGTDNQRLRCYL
jgi:hypothetical protein